MAKANVAEYALSISGVLARTRSIDVASLKLLNRAVWRIAGAAHSTPPLPFTSARDLDDP
jgi:hypothetical protein